MKHVVVVDSDSDLRTTIANYLARNAFRVSAVVDLDACGQVLMREVVDLLIIDWRSHVDECQPTIHQIASSSDIPFIVISGERTAEADKVIALEAGACDYITKPVGMRELLARVRVATRERKPSKSERPPRAYQFNEWTLFLKQKVLRQPDFDDIKLSSAEFNLLVAFLKLPRRVLTRERLLAETRLNGEEIFDRSVDVLILRLRRKIEQDPSRPQLIRTRRGAGYLFDADVSVIERAQQRPQ